ncbi:MAG: DUF998 domain-containing protein [Hyphomonadaceae bacterium]|nr:DUF998 domain-containing protein [Hyphomonadaceae bacterium]MBX3511924.1 DUF998 domain-containing protein [Hyphomonadaceae bacterium]
MGKLAMICAVVGGVWWLVLVAAGGLVFPGYDHLGQYISELGATGAPNAALVNFAGFLPLGILFCTFAIAAYIAAPHSRLAMLGFVGLFFFAVGYVGAAFYPCDYGCRPAEPSESQNMHLLLGLAGYLLAPITLLCLGLAARSWPGGGRLALWALVAAPVAAAGLLTMDPASPYVGVSQRVLEVSVVSWCVACGLYLGRQPRAR